MAICYLFRFLLLVSATTKAALAIVVPLHLHERSPLKGNSFLAVSSRSQSRLEYYRARHNNTHAIEYSGDIKVGNQTFSMIFDTGSDQLILPGLDCVSDACKKHRVYDPKKSRTATNLSTNDARQCQFGAGSVMGYEREDQVCFGDACASAEFVEALIESDDPFLTAHFDGVLGLSLALRKNATVKSSVLEALVASKAIPSAVFSVFMAKDLHSDVSELSFGEPNAARMTGDITWVPLSEPGYWQFSLSSIRVGGKQLSACGAEMANLTGGMKVVSFSGMSTQGHGSPVCCSGTDELDYEDRCQFWGNATDTDDDGTERIRSRFADAGVIQQVSTDGRVAIKFKDGCLQNVPRKWVSLDDGCRGDGTIQALLDTGSSLMMAPTQLSQKILSALGVQENCTTQDPETFPSLTLTLPTGKELTLTPADYMDTVVENDGVYCWPHLIPMPITAKGPALVLGMPFLRTYYTTFDAENKRVGFATPKQPPLTAAKTHRDTARSVNLRAFRPGDTEAQLR